MKSERRITRYRSGAGASIRHRAAADRARQCFPHIRSALRGIDPRDPPPNLRSYRSASHETAPLTRTVILSCTTAYNCSRSTSHVTCMTACTQRRGPPRNSMHIVTSSNRGVSDLQTGPERSPGTETGVAHALVAVLMLELWGGTERRPSMGHSAGRVARNTRIAMSSIRHAPLSRRAFVALLRSEGESSARGRDADPAFSPCSAPS